MTDAAVNTSFNPTLTDLEKNEIARQVDYLNKQNTVNGRTASNSLGKDDFLKLFIEQMKNQDPTSPMDNTQMATQMAQFSSLEQMTNMNASFAKLNSMMVSSSAVNTIGKTVDLNIGDATTSGVVQAVTYGENPQVKVNGMYYDMAKIQAVYGN